MNDAAGPTRTSIGAERQAQHEQDCAHTDDDARALLTVFRVKVDDCRCDRFNQTKLNQGEQ